jgi:arginyl-tRNA synthetase
MNIQTKIASIVISFTKDQTNNDIALKNIQIQRTIAEFDADFTLLVFPIARFFKKSPEETATILGNHLVDTVSEIESFSVIKGFLNIKMTDKFWLQYLSDISALQHFGSSPKNSKPRVIVEYSSPNTNKPLHLGHLRNIFLGYSVAEILKANGHEVTKVQIINDRGIHICKSMLAWQRFGAGETPESTGLKGDKLVGKYYVIFDKKYKEEIAVLQSQGQTEEEAKKNAPIILQAQEMLLKWEAKDAETYKLWLTMNGWVYKGFDITYQAMRVDFDKLYYESETYLLGRYEVLKGLENGIFYKKDDGSIWVDLTAEGLDQKVLLRADGTAMYITQDIGTAILRFKDFPESIKMIYTVGNEQEYHFKVLFLILQKLGFQWAKECFHLSYGMVELPEGKMKSREGTVVDADDMIEEMFETAKSMGEELGKLESFDAAEKENLFKQIGMASLKYFLLKVDPKKNMMFNPKESISIHGNTGSFIQYTHARIKSILRKSEIDTNKIQIDLSIRLNVSERKLLHTVSEFPFIIEEAGNNYSPAILANYTYELVKEYNTFYQSSVILKEENESLRNFRIILSEKTATIVKDAMLLLGIEVPERM